MHPWKTEEGLTIDGYREDEDAELEQAREEGKRYANVCADCLGGLFFGCNCEAWPDDCWAGPARPYDDPNFVGIYTPWRLSAKGRQKQRQARAVFDELNDALEERGARRKARGRWLLVKDLVDAKRIGLYWMEQTQRSLCAPGGAGRTADRDAFRAEF